MSTDSARRTDRKGGNEMAKQEPQKGRAHPKRIRLLQTVRGDWPIGHMYAAYAGIYEEKDIEVNPHGAVAVKLRDGTLLGVKPDEFEWIGDEKR